MKKMLPLMMYVAVAAVCQAFTVALALGVEQVGYKWGSVTVFGVLYLVMFAVAWKITVIIMDGFLAKRGWHDVETAA